MIQAVDMVHMLAKDSVGTRFAQVNLSCSAAVSSDTRGEETDYSCMVIGSGPYYFLILYYSG